MRQALDKMIACATTIRLWAFGKGTIVVFVKKAGNNPTAPRVMKRMWAITATFCVTPGMRDTAIQGTEVWVNYR